MNLLLTNDDGYGSEGIEALRSALSPLHSVYVVAPSANRSGSSCSIHMDAPLNLEERGSDGRNFALDGTPADCVIAALKGGFLPCAPDAVVSGINRDGNLGTDIVYSGTCGAARQASLYGIPSLAVSAEKSLENGKPVFRYGALARFVAQNLIKLLELCGPANEFFVNVNAPSASCFAGVRWASVCMREYNDSVVLSRDEAGNVFTRLAGGPQVNSCGAEFFDQQAVEQGFVSLSRIRALPCAENPAPAGSDAGGFICG